LSVENIFSAPTASTMSAAPARTQFTAGEGRWRWRSVLDVDHRQRLRAMSRKASWPRIMCCPSMWPWVELAKKALCSNSLSQPAPPLHAARVSFLMLSSRCLPNGVMPTPAI
jgi:hypothetical protein